MTLGRRCRLFRTSVRSSARSTRRLIESCARPDRAHDQRMTTDPLRVLIVDDSRIFRGVIEEALTSQQDVVVAGSVWSGEKAIEFLRQRPVDLVTLDIEMPGMGGLETLRAISTLGRDRQRPTGVLLVSSFTRRGAAITIEGLAAGAFDFVTKPAGPDEATNAAQLREKLREKLIAFRANRGKCRLRALSALESRTSASAGPPLGVPPAISSASGYRALVIGASTGGPDALSRLLPDLAPGFPLPIFLVQHMPAGFTEYFAASLARRCGCPVFEAANEQAAVPGTIHVAPGGKHLVVRGQGSRAYTAHSDAPPENSCRPSADVLFRSAASAYGAGVLALILTGMGSDGTKGAAVLKRAGSHVVAQDEATSVVWGMPGSAVAAGVVDEVLPLDAMAAAVRARLGQPAYGQAFGRKPF